MSRVAFGRLVSLVTEKAEEASFKIGLEAIESGTGKLAEMPNAEYSGEGVAFAPGDLLFGKLRPYLAKGWLADRPGAAVGDFHVYRCGPRLVPEYARWIVLANNFLDPVVSSVFGAKMPRASWDFVRTVEVHVPSLVEQRAIADYLDRETAQIDTLIEEQQRLVRMLRERRVAVVDEVLSLGLDPSAGQIETGNQWLPTLPVGWGVVRARNVIESGPSNGVSPEAATQGDLRTLSLSSVRDGRVTMSADATKFVDRAAVKSVDALRLQSGDILIVRGNGNIRLVARAGLVGPEFDHEEYIYPDLLIRVRVGPQVLPDFFVWAFDSTATRTQIESQVRTAVGTFKVAADDVRNVALPLPPFEEQARIVEHLRLATAKTDTLIEEAERLVDVALERRAALITAAVTGQIDVRAEVA